MPIVLSGPLSSTHIGIVLELGHCAGKAKSVAFVVLGIRCSLFPALSQPRMAHHVIGEH